MVLLLQDPRELKLFREGAELRDSTTLAEAQVQNGDTLAMTFALPDGAHSNMSCPCTSPPLLPCSLPAVFATPCWPGVHSTVVVCTGGDPAKFEEIDIMSHDDRGDS